MKVRFSVADYRGAEQLLPTNLIGSVTNATVNPNWIGESDWFWYRREGNAGDEFVLFDARTGAREAAFDPNIVAHTIEAITGEAPDTNRLGVIDLKFDYARASVEIFVPNAVLVYDRIGRACTGVLARPIEAFELLSPDKRLSVFCRDNNLWLLDRQSGESLALTTDGVKHCGYGVLSDAALVAIPVAEGQLILPPINVVWSPDSHYVVVARVDERHVHDYSFLRSVPSKGARPIPYVLHRALIGDRSQPVVHLAVIDVVTHTVRSVTPTEPAGLEADCDMLGEGTCWFDSHSRTIFIPQVRDALRMKRLIAIDLESATRRTILEERVDRFAQLNLAIYNTPNVRILNNSGDIVWFSEKDGWGHLYLYGSDGALKHQITCGEWVVFDIVYVDEERRLLYFTGSSRDPSVNPYLRFLYRVSLDGGEPVLLTPENADHMIDGMPQPMVILLYRRAPPKPIVSPSGKFFVDTYSTLANPPVSLVRSAENGEVLATVEHANAAGLLARQYTPPEEFVAKAADGETNIHGVIYWPPHHDPKDKYPIIDALYNGFQVSVVPRNFVTGHLTPNPYGALALARLGFIVVTLDARGTALRCQKFHDHSYRNFGDAGIDDHVAVIRQLGARYPSIDLGRVGASGYSFGGYYSTRALLTQPDFFKVAVSGAGCHNWQGMYPGYENLIGEPVFSDGTACSPDGYEIPQNYLTLDNASLASQLRGKLMLFIGDLDENVPPPVNFQFAEALQRANKDFDLLVIWGATHYSSALHPYVIRKSWDFFIRHLMGAEPPDWNREA